MPAKFGCYVITSEFETIEMKTFTCGHCNRPQIVKPRGRAEDLGGNCSVCWSLICSRCVNTGACDPFEEKLKRAERHGAALRSYGI